MVLVGALLAAASLQLSSQTPSAPKPAGARAAAKAAPFPSLWRSLTTGKEYLVKVDGDRVTAEWLNVPAEAAKRGAYIRSECRRSGSRWIGTSHVLEPCALPDGKIKMCPMSLRFEIDFLSPERITGGGETLRGFDCASCEVRKTGWGPFSWAPKP
jgi:hypothetical protein